MAKTEMIRTLYKMCKELSFDESLELVLDTAQEVCVYAKLPKSFHIPTPVGNYSPDWAIAFYEGTVQ